MCQAWGESAAHSHTRSRARTAAREPLAPAAAAAPRFSSWQREPSGRGRWPRESESGLRGVGSRRADRAGAGGEGGSPRPGPESRSAAPGLSNPPPPVRAPACRADHSSRGAPGLGADLVGVGIVAPLAVSLGGAPPGQPLKDAIVAAERIGAPGRFIYLFIYLSLPFSPRPSPFVSRG